VYFFVFKKNQIWLFYYGFKIWKFPENPFFYHFRAKKGGRGGSEKVFRFLSSFWPKMYMCAGDEVSGSRNEEVSLRWVYPPLKRIIHSKFTRYLMPIGRSPVIDFFFAKIVHIFMIFCNPLCEFQSFSRPPTRFKFYHQNRFFDTLAIFYTRQRWKISFLSFCCGITQ